MHKLFLVFIVLFMTGCTTSPHNYLNFTLSDGEKERVAADLALFIKEKHGAATTFEFDYPMRKRSSAFSHAFEIALRKQGLAVYAKDINDEHPVAKTHKELYYTLDTLNDGQLYIRVMVDNRFSFQRIWLRDSNDILRPLATTSVFEGVDDE